MALIGGTIALRLHQPPLIGYLVGGIAIGPYGLGLIGETGQVQTLAEIGVVLLMFALGVEFSLENLKPVRKIAVLGGSLQIIILTFSISAIALPLGWPLATSTYLGCIFALSSTMIVLKTLMDRGELDSLQGKIMIGVLMVQDLSVVPMMVILPTLVAPGQDALLTLALAILKAVGLLLIMLQFGSRFVPWFMAKVAAMQSRELFLLAIISLSLGAAFVTFLFGLSLAVGAFIAGLTLSESEFNLEILADIVPLRDTFSTLFFASIGMLLDPRFVLTNFGAVIAVVIIIALGKFLTSAFITRGFGYPPKVSLIVGLGLIQIGEFSFVLARQGVDLGAIPEYLYSLILAAAIVTILFTPLAFKIADPAYALLTSNETFRTFIEGQTAERVYEKPERLANHVVICGYGRVSRSLVQILERRRVPHLVIEINPHLIADLRAKGTPCIFGDASNRFVLEHAELRRARVLVVAIPDPIGVERIIRYAREIHPPLDIVARATLGASLEFLRGLGATEVVEPEFEAGLEVLRHTLSRLGLGATEAQYIVNTIRIEHYSTEEFQ